MKYYLIGVVCWSAEDTNVKVSRSQNLIVRSTDPVESMYSVGWKSRHVIGP